MTYDGTNNNQFVTIAHDGMIKIWDANTITLVKSARIKCGYLTSLINYKDGYMIRAG